MALHPQAPALPESIAATPLERMSAAVRSVSAPARMG